MNIDYGAMKVRQEEIVSAIEVTGMWILSWESVSQSHA